MSSEATQATRDPLSGTLRMGSIPTIGPYLLPRMLPGPSSLHLNAFDMDQCASTRRARRRLAWLGRGPSGSPGPSWKRRVGGIAVSCAGQKAPTEPGLQLSMSRNPTQRNAAPGGNDLRWALSPLSVNQAEAATPHIFGRSTNRPGHDEDTRSRSTPCLICAAG